MTASPSNKSFTVGYSYSSGRQTGITYPSGRAITFGFDAKGGIASITVDGSTTILSNAKYFPFGGPSGWTWGNSEPMQRYFDLDGRISALTLGPASGTYADLSQTYGYDSLNRLTSANLGTGSTQSYTYDANSNRTNLTVNGTSSTNYNYPSSSHKLSSLSGATSKSFTYDSAGNATASGSLTLVYDGRGRMKQAASATYLVNGLGQRVRKNTGSDTYFAYDEVGHLIGEYDSSGAAIEETVWLGDLPVAIIKPSGGSFTVFYIWTDNLGSPRQVSDTSNVVRWTWDNNDPFGNNASNENPAGAGAFSYSLRFPGQYADAESGLNYNYFRDYDPNLGRYVESDPIGLRGGINSFAYVYDRPLMLFDRLGLKSRVCCKNIPILLAMGSDVRHCYIETQTSTRTTYGLQGPPVTDGFGYTFQGNSFDMEGGGACGDWNDDCGTDSCVDKTAKGYPNPTYYGGLTSNSNTFAGNVARKCNLKRPIGSFPTPGWDNPVAAPAAGAAPLPFSSPVPRSRPQDPFAAGGG